MTRSALACLLAACLLAGAASAAEPIYLANNPALSPDGSMLAFDWNGDLWTAPVKGGLAKPLTRNPARDRQPRFSPTGKELAFISDREEGPQVFVMPAEGGAPTQVTFHTAGCALEDWTADGKSLLIAGARDHAWRHSTRFFLVGRSERKAEAMLFDDYGQSGSLSPDGRKLLFTREGEAWWRKGYKGSQASQIWLYDRDKKGFDKLIHLESSSRWPLWKPDGKGFYYVGASNGTAANLFEFDLGSGQKQQLTNFTDDTVAFPCLSRDGSTIVFRHLFDLYSLQPGRSKTPQKISLMCDDDNLSDRKERRTLQSATAVAFSADGLEIAFISGGDLWVMDTELREPRQITSTPEEERDPVFSPDGEGILFVSDQGGQSDIWRAERADRKRFWWRNPSFKVERITNDPEVESNLKWSPEGSQVAFLKGRGDLCVMNADGKNVRVVFKGWDAPQYDWSPDGQWFVYSRYDPDFNRDIWLAPLDGSRPPFNLSRSPFNDGSPVWSPDGKMVAFTGRRSGPATEVYFVWLKKDDDEKSSRDRALERALEKINRARQGVKPPAVKPQEGDEDEEEQADPPVKKPAASTMAIDFDRIFERIQRVPIGETMVSNLLWSPDSKKLAFAATIEGRRGMYTIDIPTDLKPKLLTTTVGSNARWIRTGNQILWFANGVPSSQPGLAAPTTGTTTPTTTPRTGSEAGEQPRIGFPGTRPTTTEAPTSTGTAYRFTALQTIDLRQRNAAAFDLCWRTMRDNWYDERLGNRDWNVIRKKYRDMAGRCTDNEAMTTVVQLMLGELNGSHLGFTMFDRGSAPPTTPAPTPPVPTEPTPPAGRGWTAPTAHLGIRFDHQHEGMGLKVRDVLPKGPADQKKSRLEPGDIVLKIDGTDVGPTTDLTTVLNGPLPRDVVLTVRSADRKERFVTIRPTTYLAARMLLYDKWQEDNRKRVEAASDGKLGYLHISAMSMPSFYKFEEELYAAGAGKDGLVIDVRENGGGSTADHLLTALTQPVHAVAVPRGGSERGYPQDRKVYATWNKPIIVLCNQNSFSNAEIFSHAIKTLKRGQLVGVPTAGGVVSTGGVTIMDVGFLRLPFRGWYLVNDGEDMELHGAVPHHIVWPKPGDMPQGKDEQLAKAVEVLSKDVEAWKQRPQPALRKATERPVK